VPDIEESVGSGTNLFPAGRLHGAVRWFHNPADVVSAEEDGLPEVIAFVSKGGMTFLSPILADVKAVVCTAGSLESPLAILAREFEVPCVMGTELAVDLRDGDEIVLDLDDDSVGTIVRVGRASEPVPDGEL
jgi:phosphohistidine swiveling domain-containing protein